MSADDGLVWRKATASTAQGSDCVEVADLAGGGRAVRDSKNPQGPVLRFDASAWGAFVAGVKGGGLGL